MPYRITYETTERKDVMIRDTHDSALLFLANAASPPDGFVHPLSEDDLYWLLNGYIQQPRHVGPWSVERFI